VTVTGNGSTAGAKTGGGGAVDLVSLILLALSVSWRLRRAVPSASSGRRGYDLRERS
jgi:hypothetical protein